MKGTSEPKDIIEYFRVVVSYPCIVAPAVAVLMPDLNASSIISYDGKELVATYKDSSDSI